MNATQWAEKLRARKSGRRLSDVELEQLATLLDAMVRENEARIQFTRYPSARTNVQLNQAMDAREKAEE